MTKKSDERMINDARSMSIYFEDVRKYELLTVEQERKLGKRARAGDESAREELVNRNLRFVANVAGEYAKAGFDYEDLVQEGNMGLYDATARWDERRGFRFLSYAQFWIRQRMLLHTALFEQPCRLPANRANDARVLRRALIYFRERGIMRPTPEELVAHTGMTMASVKATLYVSRRAMSLDADIQVEGITDGTTLMDLLVAEDAENPLDNLGRESMHRSVHDMLAEFGERERRVIMLRYGLDESGRERTLEEVGQIFGVTRERIRQIIERVVDRVKENRGGRFDAATEYAGGI